WSSGKNSAANSSIVAPAGVNIASNLIGGTGTLGCFPLPVDLMSFTATKKNETVVLDWTTASEKNNNKFVIERSSDGINWVSIGEVMGVGNTNSITNYTFTDANPLDGTSYYHFRQIDINGNASVSRALVVFTSDQLISVSPNPFNDVLTIMTNIKGDINISIYDVLGRLLYETNKEVKDGLLTIHPELASGAYIVTVGAGEFVKHYRVIKE
ncbi:MAG TPA: T9SS type A sorting domain-containing protein, partial [Cytophagaceae bacterium]|nr:T9SS type A sorting domain-containing protein [Cytophagaceae bacterium]